MRTAQTQNSERIHLQINKRSIKTEISHEHESIFGSTRTFSTSGCPANSTAGGEESWVERAPRRDPGDGEGFRPTNTAAKVYK